MGATKNLRYHVVLVSKYRCKCFVGIESDVIEAFRVAEKCSGFVIEKIAVEDGDHVHVVIRTSGTYALTKTVGRMKSLTSHELWGVHSGHLKKYYWSGRRKLWSGGYYAATVGDISAEKIEAYLRKQGHWV